MKIDLANLTPEAREAIVECLRIAARRGRQLREARERVQKAALADSLQTSGSGETDNRLTSEDQPQKANANQLDWTDPHFDERTD